MSSTEYHSYNSNSETPSFDTILVPQGMEYKTVCQGIGKNLAKLNVIAIPAGIQPLTKFLKQWQQFPNFFDKVPQGLILMGLGV
ncbi:MAG: purine phosphorylase, partial [Crocosphaera sp.]|nr:purine phosphorylase [Crocosphaera sp.]